MKDLWSLIKQLRFSFFIAAFAVATMNSVSAENEALHETTVSLVRITENGNVTCDAPSSHTFFYMAQPNKRHAVIALEGRTLHLRRQALKKTRRDRDIQRYARIFRHQGSRYKIRMAFSGGTLKRINIIENVTTGASSCRFRFKN